MLYPPNQDPCAESTLSRRIARKKESVTKPPTKSAHGDEFGKSDKMSSVTKADEIGVNAEKLTKSAGITKMTNSAGMTKTDEFRGSDKVVTNKDG